MQSGGKIILLGNFKGSGFGFSCLQQAIALNVTGKFQYLNSEKVEIQVAGSESNIQQFHYWCLSQKITFSGNLRLFSKPDQYNEFEIFNHL